MNGTYAGSFLVAVLNLQVLLLRFTWLFLLSTETFKMCYRTADSVHEFKSVG
jgi:hypothetical protein